MRLGYKSWQPPESRGYYFGCSRDSLREVALYSPFYIIAKVDYINSGCRYEGNRTICNGTRTLTAVEPIKWAFDATYECVNKQNVDLFFEADVQYITNFSFICEPMELPFCRDRFGYNSTAFPNAVGQESQIEANKALALFHRIEALFSRCYQHAILFACYGLFPQCHNNKRLFPCRLMCKEGQAGCGFLLNQVDQPIYCGTLADSLDPDVCFYKPVVCPMLQSPPFGSVIIEGRTLGNISIYQCNDGYELKGEAVLLCKPSGYWNSSVPTCESPSTMGFPAGPAALITHQGTILIASIIPGVLLLIMVIVCVYNRDSIKTFIIYNRYNPFCRNTQEQKKLFIAYSSQDRDEVSLDFVPQLKAQLHGWTVQTYQDDFTAGRPILDCIKEGVWESQAVLVLLTENFIASSWCLHEFIEAETRSALEDGFKLIVVMFSQDNQALPVELIEGLPDSLKRYIRTRVYLALWEPLFWNKLRQALAN